MSQVLTVPTHFNDIGELSDGFLDRVEQDTLILYGPVAYEDGLEIEFSVLLSDGTVALEGIGRVRAAVDGGDARVPETRYDVVLEALQLDGRSEVVFERLVIARQAVSDAPPSEEEPATEGFDAAEMNGELDVEATELDPDAALSVPPDDEDEQATVIAAVDAEALMAAAGAADEDIAAATDTVPPGPADADTETDADTGADAYTDTDADTGADAYTDMDADTGADAYTDTGTVSEAATATASDTDAATATATATDTDAATDPATDPATDADAHLEPETVSGQDFGYDVEQVAAQYAGEIEFKTEPESGNETEPEIGTEPESGNETGLRQDSMYAFEHGIASEPRVGMPVPIPSMAAPPEAPPAPPTLRLAEPPDGLTRPSFAPPDDPLFNVDGEVSDVHSTGLFNYEDGLPIPAKPPLPDPNRAKQVPRVEAANDYDVEESEPPELLAEDYEEVRLSDFAEAVEEG